jgi:hypothetical protein
MAMDKIALPVMRTERFINKTGRCPKSGVTWLPWIVFPNDMPNTCAQLLNKECIACFAAAVLGRNGVKYDCMMTTPSWDNCISK